MYIVLVNVRVKPDQVDAFKFVSMDNARDSRMESGIARFDVIQQADDPTRFVLIEAYRTSDDPAKHKETAHYNRWREAVEPLLAEPRTRTVFASVFPEDQDW